MKRKNTKTKSLPRQWTDEFPHDVWSVIVSCVPRDDAGTLLNLLSVSKSFIAVVLKPTLDLISRYKKPSINGAGLYRHLLSILKDLPQIVDNPCTTYEKLAALCATNKLYQTAPYLSEVLSIINLAHYHHEHEPHNKYVMKPADQFLETVKLEHVMYFDPATSKKAVRLYNHPEIKSVKNMPEMKHFDHSKLFQQAVEKVRTKYVGFKHDVYAVALHSGNIRERRVVTYTLLRKELKLIEPREAHRFNNIVVQLDDKKYHHIHSHTACDFMSYCFQYSGKVKRATKMAKLHHAYDRHIAIIGDRFDALDKSLATVLPKDITPEPKPTTTAQEILQQRVFW